VAHLLHEFLLEVRFRWESSRPLPGLPPGAPDHSYCLFHQKLQMINCCIERKMRREQGNDDVTSFSEGQCTRDNHHKRDDAEIVLRQF
jgi:Rab3 GTPase-activating protein catalytic subunit